MPGPRNRPTKTRKKIPLNAQTNYTTSSAQSNVDTTELKADASRDEDESEREDGRGSEVQERRGTGDEEDHEERKDRCIEQCWNGSRVVDVAAFLASHHAAPPSTSLDDPAYTALRTMLLTVLPSETAMILWYNKTRTSARICAACRRFYALGDILFPHLVDDTRGSRAEYVDPRNGAEKRISGLCSLMCFGLASYSWPGAIGAWGKWASEIDASTHALLQGPGANIADEGLGAVMKLSRVENIVSVVEGLVRAGGRLY
ncbi:hypothetical protein K439DRAFT_1626657 [Ramaria rubella]|nr:hypothetical protein K439DRAFT_1626657 [Ramaria rubella]